jgi:hypothetical protein
MSKRTFAQSIIFLVLLLVCHKTQAAVVEVDVTLKSVDAKARGITVAYETKGTQKSIDLDVSRKAKITINGKDGTLDSLKPGQKAKVSYEKELQVVTKIVATGEGTAPGRAVCRLLLSISEFADCTLKVEQTTTPISSATEFEGKPMKLTSLPNAEVLKASDGQVRIIHSFDHSDELASIFSNAGNAKLNKATKMFTLMPKSGKEAFAYYGSQVQLPAVLCYDCLPIRANSLVYLSLSVPASGELGVHLRREGDGTVLTYVSWDTWDNAKKIHRSEVLGKLPFDISQGCERKFRLPLPNVRIDQNCVVFMGANSDAGKREAHLAALLIQGRLHPDLGIQSGEQMSLIFAASVVPGSYGEKAGLKAGDVLVSINGKQPKSLIDAVSLFRKCSYGDQVQFKIRRGDKELELKVVLE